MDNLTIAAGKTRTARLRDRIAIDEIALAHPELPVPFTGPDRAAFYFIDHSPEAARERVAKAKQVLGEAFGVTFGWHDERASNGMRRQYTAELPSRLKVVLTAKAEHMQDEAVPAGSRAAA